MADANNIADNNNNGDDDARIEPGGINLARTKCKCSNCEELLPLDPSWTYQSTCPLCEEGLFCYVCFVCKNWCSYGSDEPAFADQPCEECGKTVAEQQEEEEEEHYIHQLSNRQSEEQRRVARGANFRDAKIREPMPVYQNNILLTYRALFDGEASPLDPPVSEADALRMRNEDWQVVRPLVVAELGADASSTLNINWCKHQITVFERTWQLDHMAALERGTVEDWTGKPYMLPWQSLKVRIRSLREAQLEEGCMPVAPAMKIDEEAWYKTTAYDETGKRTQMDPMANFMTWDPLPANYEQDPREIYKLDGNQTLTLFEFLVWSARVGGFAGQRPNPKWNLQDGSREFKRKGFATVEPIGYIPSDWVGRSKLFEQDKDRGRWHWLQKQVAAGDFGSNNNVRATIEANMKQCSVCYGPPKDGRTDLILCECESIYWCSEECKKKAWELHTLDHRQRHTVNVVRICLGCGTEGGNELLRCGRCSNAYFCGRDCQKSAWNDHKKECKKYARGGRMEWSNVA